jgi:hypothetical protein
MLRPCKLSTIRQRISAGCNWERANFSISPATNDFRFADAAHGFRMGIFSGHREHGIALAYMGCPTGLSLYRRFA